MKNKEARMPSPKPPRNPNLDSRSKKPESSARKPSAQTPCPTLSAPSTIYTACPARAQNRAQNKEQIKAKILLASAQVFAAKGYDGASVREITSLADVNLANISYYFGGKEKLFHATIDAAFAPVMAFIESIQHDALAKNLPPESVLKSFLNFVRDFSRKEPFGSFSVYLISLNQPVAYVLQNYSMRIFGFLRSVVERAQEQGSFRADVPSGYACMTFFSIFQSYFKHRDTIFAALPIQESGDYFEVAFSIFLHGMRAQSSPTA